MSEKHALAVESHRHWGLLPSEHNPVKADWYKAVSKMMPKNSKMSADHPQATWVSESHSGLPTVLRETEFCVKRKGTGKGTVGCRKQSVNKNHIREAEWQSKSHQQKGINNKGIPSITKHHIQTCTTNNREGDKETESRRASRCRRALSKNDKKRERQDGGRNCE